MSAAETVAVCRAADVPPGEGRAVAVAGRRLAIFNADGGWYATEAACPHLGGPLADGVLADSCVICPLHERRFDLESGEDLGDGDPVSTYPVAVRAGIVEVTLRESALAR